MQSTNSFCTPLRAVWNVNNDPTETLWWPVKESSKNDYKIVLFFIPGNPGLVEYYTQFLEDIYQATESKLEIYGVSHLGHSVGHHTEIPNKLQKSEPYSLQDQIDHKIACFDEICAKNPPNTHYMLMGHSMGSYVCAEVLKARQTANIGRLIALFPTLREIALTPNGVAMTRLLSSIPLGVVSGAASVASYIPSPIRQVLTGLVTGQKEPCLRVTAHQMMNGFVVKNILHMAIQEMETIKDLDHDFYDSHVDKFIIYYSKNDKWAPEDHFDYMKEKFPKGSVRIVKSIKD
ncbi:hypothetical protein CLU79DRAFT_733745 [Phycomyces nitens]|nr:hypothetical protein CLU79DRAFT_733745 [Phycomyces nitens]